MAILVGLIGWPVAHSLSPAMHRAAARALELPLDYVAMPVRPQALAAAVSGLPALGFRGVNVTIPHKTVVLPLLDEVDPAARAIGAVNTIVFGEQATGHNTDWRGFLADLRANDFDPAGRDCLILGAGGAARAAAYGLATAGGRARVLARRPQQAAALVEALSPGVGDGRLAAAPLSDLPGLISQDAPSLIVNATPLGMSPDDGRSVWPDDLPFPPGALVYDLVYNPAETRLITQARAGGCRAVNGLGMLVEQGAAAFALWTGLEADRGVMGTAAADSV